MTLYQWLALAGICLAGATSPGPSLTVVLSATIGGGRPAGVAAAWAHATGVALYALLTVIGVAALLSAQPALLQGLQFAGALYLLHMAWRLASARGSTLAAGEQHPQGVLRAARDGFAIAFLNPKLLLFMLALFSQFVATDYGALELAIMVATAGVIDGGWYTLVALLLTQRRWLEVLRRRAAQLDRVFALLLALLAGAILLELARALPTG